ncbi:Uncharacterised protein [Klebsiella michiganensis]|uniref:Uncharacterized protein n=1 Tax=Klebsiella michiganensis TaxID=1134687 RepID=A0A7H4PPQ2_9ENTR|nr:Uncharacterised protein [Klebsiella michiganensis]
MATRMEIQQRQAELLAAGEFINKGIAGFFQRVLNRMTEVYQIAVVRQNLPGPNWYFSQAALNSAMVSSLRGAARHWRWFFGKEGKCGRADFGCANGGVGYTAGGADVPLQYIS